MKKKIFFCFLLIALSMLFWSCPPGGDDKAPTVTSVTVSPATTSVHKGGTHLFTKTVKGENDPADTVTWTVEGGITGTTIHPTGILEVSANETASTLTVKATSTVDTTKSGTATVTITSLILPTDARIKDPATTNTQLTNANFTAIVKPHGGGNKWLKQTPDRLGYETWDEDTSGDASFVWYGSGQGGGAAFKAEWGNPNRPTDFLARVGYFWNEGKSHTDYGNIYCGYNFDTPAQYRGNFSYIGIYGWSRNPGASIDSEKLVEYYIVENSFGNAWYAHANYIANLNKDTLKGDEMKSYTIDGSVYKVYKVTRTGPSISGNTTFTQFFSVRQTARTNGTIQITRHFEEWEKQGMSLGTNIYECKFKIEVGGKPDNGSAATTGSFDARLIQFYRANDDGSIIQITE